MSYSCGTGAHVSRRTLLGAAMAAVGGSWLTPIAHALAQQADRQSSRPRSVILLWLSGGPSQLETFDPHPDTTIAAGTSAIETRVAGIQFAEGLEQTADQMDVLAIVRNVVSKEGDHERAIYNVKTGYRPDPTLVHPSLGAICCHQLPRGATEIPRHISIQPNSSYGRGGYLGAKYDAFQVHGVNQPLPDMVKRVADDRFRQRLSDLHVVEKAFTRGRLADLEQSRTAHQTTVEQAVRMMNSDQLTAFDIGQESQSVRRAFGDSDFGRGCLAALRLIDVGVRCVEVTLGGWDSHVDNHDIHTNLKKVLDPALASLLKHLRDRELLEDTIVLCGGEFGRTPELRRGGGRDHWPHGFSIAMAGGGIRPGVVLGETDPDGGKVGYDQGTTIADLHATILHQLGIQQDLEMMTPVGRPMKLSEGEVLPELIA